MSFQSQQVNDFGEAASRMFAVLLTCMNASIDFVLDSVANRTLQARDRVFVMNRQYGAKRLLKH